MAPLIPRFHLFEIDDQPWFPAFLRARVQDGLTEVWLNAVPPLQRTSPARIAASLLQSHLGPAMSSHTFVDFCAGSGGPTPAIERYLNRALRASSQPEVDFVLTDLHPNPESWARAAANSDHLRFESSPVDAAAVDGPLLARLIHPEGGPDDSQQPSGELGDTSSYANAAAVALQHQRKQRKDPKKAFRLFNLAFHHFDDPLASLILRNTLETSGGFAIFELQGRDPHSFLACILGGLAFLFVSAPLLAWRARPRTSCWDILLFGYLIPILPFVLVWDGWISSLRTRTPDEVETLMKKCGADCSGWEVSSGSEAHLWPVAYLNWIIVTKKPDVDEKLAAST